VEPSPVTGVNNEMLLKAEMMGLHFFIFRLFVGSRPSDHYFCSVCWFVCLSVCLFVCLFVRSFSQPSLIRF